MRPLSEATARISGNAFKRKYIALGRIVKHWEDIVGKNLADKAQPVKINYRKHPKSKKPVASLDIAVSSADATTLHYQKDLILERINQIFGEQWISAIRFVHHAPANNARAMAKKNAYKKGGPLTEKEKKSLSEWLSDIEDEDIKARLSRLGEGIMSFDKGMNT